MDIKQSIVFKSVISTDLSLTYSEEGPSEDELICGFKALLTPEIAEVIGIRWVYMDNAIARENLKKVTCNIELKDHELRLEGKDGMIDRIYPELIAGFQVSPAGGGKLFIAYKVTNRGEHQRLLEFFFGHRGDSFTVAIGSRQQGQLFDGGTRVDLTAGKTEWDGPETVSAIVETKVVEIGTPDRSYETRPRGGRKSRDRKSNGSPLEGVAVKSPTVPPDVDVFESLYKDFPTN